jgi:hypothetical protein
MILDNKLGITDQIELQILAYFLFRTASVKNTGKAYNRRTAFAGKVI